MDSSLYGSGKISKATICGLDGQTQAASAGFRLSPEEVRPLINGFKDSASVLANGVCANGMQYGIIRADERSIYGRQGSDGLVAVKTGKCVVVEFYSAPVRPGDAVSVVENLGTYLIETGYWMRYP